MSVLKEVPRKVVTDTGERGDRIERSIESTSQSLIQAAKMGDEQAREDLYLMYYRLVCHWCLEKGVRVHAIDDIVQDVYVALFEALPTFEHNSFRGFLWTLTRNKIRDHFRREGWLEAVGSAITRLVDNVKSVPSASRRAEETEMKEIIRGVADVVKRHSSERDFRACEMCTIEDMTGAQVAAILGCNRNQVYLANSRVLGRMREILEQDWQEHGCE